MHIIHFGLSQDVEYSSLCYRTLLFIPSILHLLIPDSQFLNAISEVHVCCSVDQYLVTFPVG